MLHISLGLLQLLGHIQPLYRLASHAAYQNRIRLMKCPIHLVKDPSGKPSTLPNTFVPTYMEVQNPLFHRILFHYFLQCSYLQSSLSSFPLLPLFLFPFNPIISSNHQSKVSFNSAHWLGCPRAIY